MLLLLAAAATAEDVTAPPPSWNLGLASSLYAFQTESEAGETSDHTIFLQRFSGGASGLAGGRISVRASGRVGNLPLDPGPEFLRRRLYTGYLDARLTPRLGLRVGRQLVQTGAAFLTLDGARAEWIGGGALSGDVWAGAKAPSGLAALGDFDLDSAVGASAVLRLDRDHRLTFAAANRERGGVTAEQPLSLQYAGRPVRSVRAFARTVYDLEADRLARFELQGQWRAEGGGPVATCQYIDRHPSIDAASWFSRFTDLERIKLARAAVRWENARRIGGEVELIGSFVGERRTSRLGVAALLPGVRVGYAVRGGDVGDESSLYGEVSWQAAGWLRLEAEASRLTYALLADGPEEEDRELTTLAGRALARLRPGLNLTAEVQRLENPEYAEDVRLLVGMNIGMGRGASRFGLDRGGWLQ